MKRSTNIQFYGTIIAGISCFVAACLILVITKPFTPEQYYAEKPLQTEEISVDTSVEDTSPVQTASTHNYDTLYGDKNITDAYNTMCQDFVDTVFGTGYRSIVLGQDSYIQNVTNIFPNGRVDYQKYRFDSSQFASFVANLIGTQELQIEVKWEPVAEFSYDDITVINGDITFIFHNGADLTEITRFLDIDKPELNTPYTVPSSFKISHTTNALVGFQPAYQPVE